MISSGWQTAYKTGNITVGSVLPVKQWLYCNSYENIVEEYINSNACILHKR